MHDCLIAFGSNIGDGQNSLQQSLSRLDETRGITCLQVGRPVCTQPVGGPADQPNFLNAAIRLQTELSAEELHKKTIEIERELGRVRGQRWGSRKVDLDLLLYGDLLLESDQLVIPHPRMTFRRFVLEPAEEIAGDMFHPGVRMTISELIQHLDQASRLIVWATPSPNEIRSHYAALFANEALQGWTLELVDQFEDYKLLERDAKLVISSGDLFSQWKTSSFRGPTLALLQNDSDTVQEIVAAVLAMEPIDGSARLPHGETDQKSH